MTHLSRMSFLCVEFIFTFSKTMAVGLIYTGIILHGWCAQDNIYLYVLGSEAHVSVKVTSLKYGPQTLFS